MFQNWNCLLLENSRKYTLTKFKPAHCPQDSKKLPHPQAKYSIIYGTFWHNFWLHLSKHFQKQVLYDLPTTTEVYVNWSLILVSKNITKNPLK